MDNEKTSVIQKKLTKNFTITDNRIAQSGLSLRAKGLYWYLSSLPDNWNFSFERIARVSGEPVSRVKQAFNELQTAGLVRREYVYGSGIYGRRSNYVIYDFDTMTASVPKPTVQKPTVEKPTVEKPTVEKPTVGLSTVEKPTIDFRGDYISNNNYKEINNNKEISNTDTAQSQATDARACPPEVAPKVVKHKYGEYSNVLLSDAELEKLQNEFPIDWQRRIEDLSCYIASTGKSYKSHLATIRNWNRMDKQRQNTGFSMPTEDDDPEFAALFK